MSSTMKEDGELSYYGLVLGPEKKVCSTHILDYAIRSYVKKKGKKSRCDYCKKIRNVVSVIDLMKFLMETVIYFYKDPTVSASKVSGEGNNYVVGQYNSWEILHENFMLKSNSSELFEDMKNLIDFNQVWEEDILMFRNGSELRKTSWYQFCYLVKHHVRYLFQDLKTVHGINAGKTLRILKDVEKMIVKYRLLREIPAGAPVFRCRQHEPNETILEAHQMRAPHVQFCRNPNRMSPAGISMFYCAFDIETAVCETVDQKWIGSEFTTVSFTLRTPTLVVDLSNLPPIPSRFDINNRSRFEDLLFLHRFVNDLTKPVTRD